MTNIKRMALIGALVLTSACASGIRDMSELYPTGAPNEFVWTASILPSEMADPERVQTFEKAMALKLSSHPQCAKGYKIIDQKYVPLENPGNIDRSLDMHRAEYTVRCGGGS